MARTPTVYRWDDPGAPDLNAIMPTSNDKKKLLIHTILKACLVDGYGTKAAAGWIMPHEEIVSNGCRFVLTNTANSGSLLYEGGYFSGGATDMNADALWACMGATGLDTILGGWSCDVPYSDRNMFAGSSFQKSGLRFKDGVDAWVVIANENTCAVIFGKSSVDFNISSSGAPSWSSSKIIFGAMHDGFGGVLNPGVGNFFIAYGAKRIYSGDSYYPNVERNVFTSCCDIVGAAKTAYHDYEYLEPTPVSTNAIVNSWLPVPVVYFQSGPSGPDGSGSGFKYLSAAIPSLRRLLFSPSNYSPLNDFLVENNFSYGKRVAFHGSELVIFRSHKGVVDVFSLDPFEWGA